MRRAVTIASIGLSTLVAIPSALAAEGQSRTDPKLSRTARPKALSVPELSSFELQTLVLPQGNPSTFITTLSLGGRLHTISGELFTLRSPDCQVIVDEGNGKMVSIPLSPPRTFRGQVNDVPGSGLAMSLIDGTLAGLIEIPGEGMYYVQPARDLDPSFPASAHIVYRTGDVLPNPEMRCGNDMVDLALPQWKIDQAANEASDPGQFPAQPPAGGSAGGAAGGSGGNEGGIAGATPQIAEIAFDADFEFYNKNGNSVTNTVNDIELVMNGVDFIYDRDVNIGYEFTTFVVRTSSADPYTTLVIEDQLCEFREQWNIVPEIDIQRDIAQLFTGKSLTSTAIGLAWLGVVCNQPGAACTSGFGNLGYSTVESRFSLILANRQAVSAHEIGHNWNAQHCDGNGDCHIMCATLGACDGIAGSNLKFGAGEVTQIVDFKNSVSCDQTGQVPLDLPFFEAFPNASIDVSKWTYINGATTSQNATNEPSATRSLNLDATGSDLYEDDEIRSNAIKLATAFQPQASLWTQHKGVEAGEKLIVEYWTSGGDWALLGEVVSDGVDEVNFVQSTWVLPANAKHDGFRLRIRVDVNETNDDWYVDDVSISQGANPPPANDECAGALAVGPGAYLFDTTNATNSAQTIPSSCDGFSGAAFAKDIWYLVTANCTGNLVVSTCGSATFDTRIAVYAAGACPSSSTQPLACSDNGAGCSGGTSLVSLNATAGSQFYVRVGGVSAGGTGAISISCNAVAPPANDECINAIFTTATSIPFDTSSATDSASTLPASCNEGNGVTMKKDVWWYYVAPCDGTLEISTCNSASFDTRLAVYSTGTGCPFTNGAAVIACSDNDTGCGLTSTLTVPCTTSTVFLIRLGGNGTANAGGAGTLNLICTPNTPPCPGDLNDDGTVNGADLGILLGGWGNAAGDLDGNGTTDGSDLGILLGAWGACP
ncbi:MAG: hypothetical protein JNM94_09460 [Phycisphaerae bacterium]|nr:hypothetical protein [Phycisphaerae bacterium]